MFFMTLLISHLDPWIYETRLTGSEFWWEIPATHKFELEAPRRKKIFSTFWVGLAYLAQRFKRHFENRPKKIGGYFCTLNGMIDPWTFQGFPITGKNFPLQKPKHFGAKIGRNRPKFAIRVMSNAILRARACRRAGWLILSESKFHGGLPKKSSRSDQPLPSFLLKTIFPL